MHPYFDRMTDRFLRVLALANEEAKTRKHVLVNKWHLLWALLQERDNIGVQILVSLQVNCKDLQGLCDKELKRSNYTTHGVLVPYGAEARKALLYAIESGKDGRYIGCQHLLMGLLKQDDKVSQLLMAKGAYEELVAKEIVTIVA